MAKHVQITGAAVAGASANKYVGEPDSIGPGLLENVLKPLELVPPGSLALPGSDGV